MNLYARYMKLVEFIVGYINIMTAGLTALDDRVGELRCKL